MRDNSVLAKCNLRLLATLSIFIKNIIMNEFTLVILYALIITKILTWNLDYSKVWCFSDLPPIPYNINVKINEALYIWNIEGLGNIITPMNSIVRFSALLTYLLRNPVIVQKVLILMPFLIGVLSFYIFARNLNLSKFVSIVVATLFVLNPYYLSIFIVGNAGVLMTIAVTPLFLVLMMKYLEKGKLLHLALLGALYYTFGWNFYFFIWLFMGMTVFILIKIALFEMKGKYKKTALKRIMVRYIAILSLIIILSLPTLVVICTTLNSVKKTTLIENVIEEAKRNYRDATFLNLIRLTGNGGSPQVRGYLNYNTLNDYTIWGLIISVIPLISLLFCKMTGRKNEHQHSICLALIISYTLFLIVIGLITLIRHYPELLKISELLFTLRNPSKLQSLLHFYFFTSFASSIELMYTALKEKLHNRKLPCVLILPIVIIGMLYNAPFLDGTLAVEKMQGTWYIAKPYYVENRYYELMDILRNTVGKTPLEENYRILYFPWERFSACKVRALMQNYLGQTPGSTSSTSNLLIVFELLKHPSKDLRKLLSQFNVKAVVVDKRFKSILPRAKIEDRILAFRDNLGVAWLTGSTDLFSRVLTASLLKKVYDDEKFAIFLVDDEYKNMSLLSICQVDVLDKEGLRLKGEIYNNITMKDVVNTIEGLGMCKPIQYTRLSPTFLKVEISTSKPVVLLFAESYNPFWKAEVYKNDEFVHAIGSIPAYSVINGFWINETGNLTIVIRYDPQSLFELGSKISMMTFVICILYFILDWRREHGDRWIIWIEKQARSIFKRLRLLTQKHFIELLKRTFEDYP